MHSTYATSFSLLYFLSCISHYCAVVMSSGLKHQEEVDGENANAKRTHKQVLVIRDTNVNVDKRKNLMIAYLTCRVKEV